MHPDCSLLVYREVFYLKLGLCARNLALLADLK